MKHVDVPKKRQEAVRPSNRRPASEVLRSVATIAYALQSKQISLYKFGRCYVDSSTNRPEGSGLAKRWAQGKIVPTQASVSALYTRIAGLEQVYCHSLFDALRDRAQPQELVLTMLGRQPLLLESSGSDLQASTVARVAEQDICAPTHEESDELAWLDVFTGFLWLVRAAEAYEEPAKHIEQVPYLYGIFPYVASISWLYPHYDLLEHCVRRVHQREPISYALCEVDWPVLRARTRRLVEMRSLGETPSLAKKSDGLRSLKIKVASDYIKQPDDRVAPESLITHLWWNNLNNPRGSAICRIRKNATRPPVKPRTSNRPPRNVAAASQETKAGVGRRKR
jgi:hypothetical protein